MRYKCLAMVFVLIVVLAPCRASAEVFMDFFFGTSDTQGSDVTASHQVITIFGPQAPSSAMRHVDFDSSPLFGIRGGFWFEPYRIGLALELSQFQADAQNVDIDIMPFSFLLMYRWPVFINDAFPNGRVRPYVGIGLASFIADISVDFRPDVNGVVDGLAEQEIALDLRAGIAWSLSEKLSIYGEVRYFKANLTLNGQSIPILSQTVEHATATINTQQLLGGFSYNF